MSWMRRMSSTRSKRMCVTSRSSFTRTWRLPSKHSSSTHTFTHTQNMHYASENTKFFRKRYNCSYCYHHCHNCRVVCFSLASPSPGQKIDWTDLNLPNQQLLLSSVFRMKGEENTVMRDYVLPDFSSIKKGFCKVRRGSPRRCPMPDLRIKHTSYGGVCDYRNFFFFFFLAGVSQ